MPVTYQERNGSCKTTFALGGASAERIFTVAWSDAFDFAKELYGRYTIFPSGEYQEPARFPYVGHLYCSEVSVDGFGVPGESSNADGIYITYAKARVVAKYTPLLREPDADPETVEEESVAVAVEMVTLPGEEYEWVDGSVAIKGDVLPGKVETTTQFSVTRYNVSSLPDATIAGLVGTVNNATWRGYTAGYALFAGADARRSITTDGAEDWEITYNFLIKSHSWNHVYRDGAAHGHYEAVQTKGGNDPIYNDGNFSNLGI